MDFDTDTIVAGERLPHAFYDRDAVVVAEALIGAWLQVGTTGGVIVETEAYRRDDAASHSHRGERPRNGAMFGPSGRAYVYRSYGIHWCFNVVCEPGSAVLVRALIPSVGIDVMHRRRAVAERRRLCSGPGRLTAALGIDGSHDRHALNESPFFLASALASPPVVIGRRIGISRDVERNWRFGLKGTRFLSRAFR